MASHSVTLTRTLSVVKCFGPAVFMNVGPGGVAADRIWAGLGSSVGVRSAAGSLVVQL
jgi:hypothetical protein